MTPTSTSDHLALKLKAEGERLGKEMAAGHPHPATPSPFAAEIEYAGVADDARRMLAATETAHRDELDQIVEAGDRAQATKDEGRPFPLPAHLRDRSFGWIPVACGAAIAVAVGIDAVAVEPVWRAIQDIPRDAPWYERFPPPFGIAAVTALLAHASSSGADRAAQAPTPRRRLGARAQAVLCAALLALPVVVVTALRTRGEELRAEADGVPPSTDAALGWFLLQVVFAIGTLLLALVAHRSIRQRREKRANEHRDGLIEAAHEARRRIEALPGEQDQRTERLDDSIRMGWAALRRALEDHSEDPRARAAWRARNHEELQVGWGQSGLPVVGAGEARSDDDRPRDVIDLAKADPGSGQDEPTTIDSDVVEIVVDEGERQDDPPTDPVEDPIFDIINPPDEAA